MENLVIFIRFVVWILLGGFASIVAYQILTRRINTKKLLWGKDGSNGYSPGRVQLLLSTLAGAFYYLFEVVENPTLFPTIPRELILILGGSNLLYLGGKFYSLLLRRSENA
jgi:hypothetical protein